MLWIYFLKIYICSQYWTFLSGRKNFEKVSCKWDQPLLFNKMLYVHLLNYLLANLYHKGDVKNLITCHILCPLNKTPSLDLVQYSDLCVFMIEIKPMLIVVTI